MCLNTSVKDNRRKKINYIDQKTFAEQTLYVLIFYVQNKFRTCTHPNAQTGQRQIDEYILRDKTNLAKKVRQNSVKASLTTKLYFVI